MWNIVNKFTIIDVHRDFFYEITTAKKASQLVNLSRCMAKPKDISFIYKYDITCHLFIIKLFKLRSYYLKSFRHQMFYFISRITLVAM